MHLLFFCIFKSFHHCKGRVISSVILDDDVKEAIYLLQDEIPTTIYLMEHKGKTYIKFHMKSLDLNKVVDKLDNDLALEYRYKRRYMVRTN